MYVWRGESIQTGGIFRKEFVAVTGLDSIYALSLKENPAPASFAISGPSLVDLDQEALYIAEENAAVSYGWTVENGTILSGVENDTLEVLWAVWNCLT